MKKAIIIGATSGIGLEVAKLLAAKGWQVGIAGRRTERLVEIVSSNENIVAYKQIDITKEEADSLLLDFINEMGGIDLYFHSSGIGWQNVELDADKEMKTVATNCVGFTRMVDTAFNYFKSAKTTGHIACITSIARTKGLGAAPSYSATKRYQSHYLECLTQMANMSSMPLTITDIRPGFVATDLISGGNYPLKLKAPSVAKEIVNAIEKKRSVVTIDWRYRILVSVWRLIPRWLWVRMKIKTK